MAHSRAPTVLKAQQLPQLPWSRIGGQPVTVRQSYDAGSAACGSIASNVPVDFQSAEARNPHNACGGRCVAGFGPTSKVQPSFCPWARSAWMS